MNEQKFVGKLNYYRRLNNSLYGCPAYYGEFVGAGGERLEGRTKSDAACAYSFLNWVENPREITYHVTRSGNAIFDRIKVLED